MNDDLVKRLRDLAVELRKAEDALLVREAADAIEELSRDLDSMNEANIALYGALPKWIPVTEWLPKKNGSYLVYVYGEVTEINFWHGKWHRLGDDYTKAVTHWMPLPEPPKEEENND